MPPHSVKPNSANVNMRVLGVLQPQDGCQRVRVAFTMPDASLHFATIWFDFDRDGQWRWRVVDDHVVQLPLVAFQADARDGVK